MKRSVYLAMAALILWNELVGNLFGQNHSLPRVNGAARAVQCTFDSELHVCLFNPIPCVPFSSPWLALGDSMACAELHQVTHGVTSSTDRCVDSALSPSALRSKYFSQLQRVDPNALTGVSKDPNTAPVGIDPTCGIPRTGPGGSLGNIANIVVCALSFWLVVGLLFRCNRRKEAVGTFPRRFHFVGFLIPFCRSFGI